MTDITREQEEREWDRAFARVYDTEWIGFDRVYVGRVRPEWRGRRCRILRTWRGRAPHNVLVAFEDGSRTVCPIRCTRMSTCV